MTTQVITDGVTLSAASWGNDVDTATYSYMTSPAGTNTITATGAANLTYAAGLLVRWIPAATNTGATTLNITPSGASALGAKAVFANGAACVGGEIQISVPAMAIYDGTQFNLVGPLNYATGTTDTTYTFDGSGGTSASVTNRWQKAGNSVTIYLAAATATSGTGSTTFDSNTALPISIRPARAQTMPMGFHTNAGAGTAGGIVSISTGGIISVRRDGSATAFGNSAVGGYSTNLTVTYSLL